MSLKTYLLNKKIKKLNKEVTFTNLFNHITYYNELNIAPKISDLSNWYMNEINGATMTIDLIENECKLKCFCFNGCSYCCNQAIYINPAEYTVLKNELDKLDYTSRLNIKNNANLICNEAKKRDIPFKLTDATKSDQIKINEEYFKLNLQCPLLDSKGSCKIYKIRPAVCWSYRNYSNPKDCSASCNPYYGYSYITLDKFVTERFYKYSIQLLKHNEYYLLPFALTKII